MITRKKAWGVGALGAAVGGTVLIVLSLAPIPIPSGMTGGFAQGIPTGEPSIAGDVFAFIGKATLYLSLLLSAGVLIAENWLAQDRPRKHTEIMHCAGTGKSDRPLVDEALREVIMAAATGVAICAVCAMSVLPLVLAAIAFRASSVDAILLLPTFSVIAGVVIGLILSWLLRGRLQGMSCVFTITGTCSGVMGGIGAGLVYIAP